MQGDLRIFVYELPQIKKYQLTLKISQFATENMVHEKLLSSNVRVQDPLRADFFFVPVYPMGVVYKYKRADEAQKKLLYDSIKKYIPQDLKVIACLQESYNRAWCQRQKYLAGFLKYTLSLLKFWDTDNFGESRHIFIFPGGDQQSIFANWKEEIGRSVHLLVEGHYGKYFQNADDKQTQQQRRHMDIVIPGGGDYDTMRPYRKRKVRKIFLSYCGRYSGSKERETIPTLLQQMKEYRKNLLFQEVCTKEQFLENLRTSRYCLTPAGSTPWTARLYGAIAQLCVPVLFNTDVFIAPYNLDAIFNDLSIRVSLEDSFELIIKSILKADYEKIYKNLVENRNKFMVNYSFPELFTELLKIRCRS